MTKKQFAALRAKQDLSDLHYPSAVGLLSISW